MNVFHIVCKMSMEDYFEFNKHNLLETPSGRKNLLFIRLIFPVIFLAILIFNFFEGTSLLTLAVQAVLFAIIAVIGWLIAHRVVLGIFRLQLRFSKDMEGDLFGNSEMTVDFDNGIITDISEKEDVRVRFENVTAVYEADKAFYIYYSTVKAFVVPYTSFNSTEEFYAFQSLLRRTFSKNG